MIFLGLAARLALALVPAAALAVAGTALGLYQSYRTGLPETPSVEAYDPPGITRFFAADGTVVGEFAEQRRVLVPYRRMPRQLVQAFLASEDRNFFSHDGIDPKGILRAAWVNLRSGRVRQGASTITQQLAKQLLVRSVGFAKATQRGFGRKFGRRFGRSSGEPADTPT